MVPKHVAVIDTETTGVDTKVAKIVEFAAYSDYYSISALVNPGIPIPAEASAVHHISDYDVETAQRWEEIQPSILDDLNRMQITCLVAHNCVYDQGMLGDTFSNFTWICTYKCALWVWPDAPSHKNEALCYWLNLGDNGRRFAQGTHSALHDAKRTYLLLNELLKHATLEQLIAWTKLPKEIKKLPFGKHVGKTWAEVDYGYLKWMISQADMDPDMIYHAKAEMKKRYG